VEVVLCCFLKLMTALGVRRFHPVRGSEHGATRAYATYDVLRVRISALCARFFAW
jgi:hypothetical protein